MERSSFAGDADELRVMARSLDIASAELTASAQRLAGELDALTWSSFAGDRWRAAVDGLISRTLRACVSLDRIAAELKL